MSGAILAIEATTTVGSLALQLPSGAVLERPLPPSREHAALLMPTIAAVLEEGGVAGDQLAAIVCATGPGSFTGVRIALATVHGLSLGWGGIPLFGATTTLTLAAAANPRVGEGVVPLIDARKKEFYFSRIRDGVEVGLTHEPAVVWWGEILPAWAAETPLLLIGDALALEEPPISDRSAAGGESRPDFHGFEDHRGDGMTKNRGNSGRLPLGVRLAPASSWYPHARHLLTLHAQGLTHGPLNPTQLQPIYIRPPDAIPPQPLVRPDQS